jgi:hypothetical protein
LRISTATGTDQEGGMMNKKSHEAKQNGEILLEFVASGL